MKVLIADDGLTIRKLLEAYLTQWGYEVVIAKNGQEAWNILQDPDSPALVILDWLMPEMDGVEICRKIRQLPHGRHMHIIILTSLEGKKNVVSALNAGADDFISKNFDIHEFHARLKAGERIVSLKKELAAKAASLEESLLHIKHLQGILPICMYCHKIRDDKEVWQNLETYISQLTDAMLSHSMCPDCMKQKFPELCETI